MEHLYDQLKQNKASNYYPLHMPGHKRNMQGFPMELFYDIDITEIDGFDNLHAPDGILKELMERASDLYKAETYLLVNGSTCGILSAVQSVLRRGETMLMARNCHKSVYHALYLNACQAVYTYPLFLEAYGICGAVSVQDIKEKLDADTSGQIKAVFITSPTYDGIVSDVRAIVGEAHKRHLPVIVDEAHGAHFMLDRRFPESAVACGADIVIHSIHKTLPALTQTALLHVQGELVDRERLRRCLRIYQTSSPSYILMAGIEQCVSILEEKGSALCDEFFKQNELFEQKVKNLKYLKVFSAAADEYRGRLIFDCDVSKKVISARGTNLNGQKLYELLLHCYKLQPEMAAQDYATAIMTVMDRKEGFDRLAEALMEIDSELYPSLPEPCAEMAEPPKQILDVYTAMEAERVAIPLESCVGKISAEFIHIYPPGIPLIVPGERFSEAVREQLLRYRRCGLTIEGMKEGVLCVKQK